MAKSCNLRHFRKGGWWWIRKWRCDTTVKLPFSSSTWQATCSKGKQWWMNVNVIKQFSVYQELQTFAFTSSTLYKCKIWLNEMNFSSLFYNFVLIFFFFFLVSIKLFFTPVASFLFITTRLLFYHIHVSIFLIFHVFDDDNSARKIVFSVVLQNIVQKKTKY